MTVTSHNDRLPLAHETTRAQADTVYRSARTSHSDTPGTVIPVMLWSGEDQRGQREMVQGRDELKRPKQTVPPISQRPDTEGAPMVDSNTLLSLLANPPRAQAIYDTGQTVVGIYNGWKLGSSYQASVVSDGVVIEVDGLYKAGYGFGERYKNPASTSYGQTYFTVNGMRQADVGGAGMQASGQQNCMVSFAGHTYLNLVAGDKVGVEMAGTAIVPTETPWNPMWLTVEYWAPGEELDADSELVFDVTSYGALGDGVHDDAPAIQAALDACDGTWGTVLIPAGTYSLTTPTSSLFMLCVGAKTNIVAAGAHIRRNYNGRMLLGNWRDTTQSFPGYSGNSHVTIDGGTWDGNPAVSTANNTMVFSHGHHVTIRNALFKDTVRAHAIDLGGVTDVLIDNCDFEGMFFSVASDPAMYREAIQLDYCGNGNGHGAPFDKTTCQRVTVSACEARTSSTPAPSGFVGGPPAALAGNHSMANGPDSHVDIVFRDNNVVDCRIAGFRILGMRNVTVKDNDIRRTGTYGAGTAAYENGISVIKYNWSGKDYINYNVKIADNGFGGAGIGAWVGGTNTSAIISNTGGHSI